MIRELVLDNLRSIHNVGSIMRTAEGFGVKHVSLIGSSPYPALTNDPRLPHLSQKQTKQIAKTALGAEKLLECRYFPTPGDFLAANRLPIICLEQTDGSQELSIYQDKQDVCLVVGSEIEGVSSALIEAAKVCLMIPMMGSKQSFNVATASGIALYHFGQIAK